MDHIAIDIGASSGRIIHGYLQQNKIITEEVHRFTNTLQRTDGHAYWDIDNLVDQMLFGLQLAKRKGITTCTIGIDTWAVDYTLIDSNGQLLKRVHSYRDHRTNQTMPKVFKRIAKEQIYEKTGVQFMHFNTLYQLFEEDNNILLKTDTVLLIPDYLNYVLTNKRTAEITNASTTQLLNIQTRDYDEDLLRLVGLERRQFPKLVETGEIIGALQKQKFPHYDLPNATVLAVASHDTASAVLGTPSTSSNWAYLSSGTWSLVGVENKTPIVNSKSLKENYTNEYGAAQTYRFLKNIMGLWVIQEVQRLLPVNYSFSELAILAKQEPPLQQIINFNDDRFLNPDNMIEEIKTYCAESNQIIPLSVGELAAAVYYNLAALVALHLDPIEDIIERPIEFLHIVGGGANNDFLNQCIATFSQRSISAGPTEATALGNLLIQFIFSQEIKNIDTGRALIKQSFDIKQYTPEPFDKEPLFQRFLESYTLLKSEEHI